MQKLQEKWTQKGVQWFTVISSAPGMEGYVEATTANVDVKKHKAHVTSVFLDPKGILVYNGAIDNAPREDNEISKTDKGEGFVNYVDRALAESMVEGKKISIPSTAPYG